jgi:aspartate carbamoyltransferase regulatory subunit
MRTTGIAGLVTESGVEMNKTLSVSAIHNGTVIDHIPAGQALRIIQLLRLLEKKHKVTVGLNLPSKRMGLKDLIKIEDHKLTKDEANEITIFAPEATINIIQNFEVTGKLNTSLPSGINAVFVCPNPCCVSRSEPVESSFIINEHGKQVKLTCRYCEKTYDRNKVSVRI